MWGGRLNPGGVLLFPSTTQLQLQFHYWDQAAHQLQASSFTEMRMKTETIWVSGLKAQLVAASNLKFLWIYEICSLHLHLDMHFNSKTNCFTDEDVLTYPKNTHIGTSKGMNEVIHSWNTLWASEKAIFFKEPWFFSIIIHGF